MVTDPKDIEENPVLSKCYAYGRATEHHFVKDNQHPYVQIKPFDWIMCWEDIMDHDFRGYSSGTLEGYEDKYYLGRKPSGIYIPRFRNFKNDKQERFLRGYAFQSGARLKGSELTMGAEFKDKMLEFGS